MSALLQQDVTANPTAPAAEDLCYAPGKALLGVQDITYLGYYDVQTNGRDTTYAGPLTSRYVNGEFRLLNLQLSNELHEISLAGRAFGARITQVTNRWLLGSVGFYGMNHIWWDEAKQRLWSTSAVDYTVETIPGQIYTRTLNSNGTVSNIHGPIGLQGIAAKRMYGAATAIPAWFQSQYGVGPYAVGFGGYTSLMRQGGGAVLGPTMYCIPEPTSFAPRTEIPTAQYRIAMDYGIDKRGIRLSVPENYFDGGDPRPNPTGNNTRPTVPPVSTAGWLSPDVNGFGRFVWGDTYGGGATFVEGPTKRGFIMIASVGIGKCWYANSTLNFDARGAEFHIYDPTHLGQVIQGQRAKDAITPVGMKILGEMSQPWSRPTGNGPGLAMTYDPLTQRLYILVGGGGIDAYHNRVLVYHLSL